MQHPTIDGEGRAKNTLSFRTKITVVGIAMAIFMAAMEATVIGTAMPTVIAKLKGIEIYSWAFAAYILATTIMTPIWGKVADLIGRRPAIFGGLLLFIIGSALCGASQTMHQLIAFRIIQGLGAAAIFPIGLTIATDILTLEQRTRAIALFSGMWGLSSLIGPIVGGYLTDHTALSWRWCFYIIIPAGLIAGAMIAFGYKEKYERRKDVVIDYKGALLLASSATSIMLVIENGAHYSMPVNVALILFGLMLIALFINIERKHPEPLIPPSTFDTPIVTIAVIMGFFTMMGLMATMSFLPLFVQAVIGTNAVDAGKILIPYIVPWTLSNIICGKLILRFGYKPIVIAGTILMMIGSLLLLQVSENTTRMDLAMCAPFLGLGGGSLMVTLLIAAQQAVPGYKMGTTTAAVQCARMIGGAFGIASMGALMNWKLKALLAGASGELARFSHAGEVNNILRPETRKALSITAQAFLQKSLAGSLKLAFTVTLVSALASLILAMFVPKGRHHELAYKAPAPAPEAAEA